MELKLVLNSRKKAILAEALFIDGRTIVKAGGKVSKGYKYSKIVKRYREDREYVDENGNILKDCEFSSPSTAAQFVNGNISNGFRAWKVNGLTLGEYLRENNNKKN